jgi:hypothetical protein
MINTEMFPSKLEKEYESIHHMINVSFHLDTTEAML